MTKTDTESAASAAESTTANAPAGRSPLTPYDTGKRAEPKPWPKLENTPGWTPIGSKLEEDRYGKVDFDDDGGSTIATIYIERDEHGRNVVHITQFADDLAVMVHG